MCSLFAPFFITFMHHIGIYDRNDFMVVVIININNMFVCIVTEMGKKSILLQE